MRACTALAFILALAFVGRVRAEHDAPPAPPEPDAPSESAPEPPSAPERAQEPSVAEPVEAEPVQEAEPAEVVEAEEAEPAEVVEAEEAEPAEVVEAEEAEPAEVVEAEEAEPVEPAAPHQAPGEVIVSDTVEASPADKTPAVSDKAASTPVASAKQDDVGAPAAPSAAGASAEVPAGELEILEQAMRRGALGEGEPAALDAAPIAADSVPPALSTEAPAAALVEPVEEPALAPELDWLAGAALPDFPVRWDDRLVEQLLYYRDNPQGRALVRALLARSGRYAEMIRGKLKTSGLPADLLYVAMVESGYDPLARSSAGAVGLWQFVDITGREYGLVIDRWVDERMSPERATDAAARFMTDLHAKLGSWPLAMAAFNMGYGALLRSIRKYNTNDIGVLTRIEAGLPYETVAYVSKITAFAIIARNPERFGLGDVVPDAPPALVSVDVPGGLGLGKLARAAGVSVEQLAALNPELQRSRIPPDVKRWSIRIPAAQAERFAARLQTLPSEAPTHGLHVMRFGERLKDVAAMYGTSETKLRALNDLADDAEVKSGAKLTVPDVEATLAPAGDDVVVGVPAQSFESKGMRRVFYAVQSGDTASGIAGAFAVTLEALRRWNDVATDAALQPGMVLQLYVPADKDLSHTITLSADRVKPLVVGSEEFFAHHEALRDRVRVRYRVRSGDTLESLGERYDLSPGSVARINGFSRYSKLEAGSEIILYVPEKDAEKLVASSARQASER